MDVKNVLVVCVGNICRSPMAEAMLRGALQKQKTVVVASAGLGALVGSPADQYAVELMDQRGISLKDHRARQIDAEMLKTANLVLVMESGHKDSVVALDPYSRGKVYRLGQWRDLEIDDPYRQPKEAFVHALKDIEDSVNDWVTRILA